MPDVRHDCRHVLLVKGTPAHFAELTHYLSRADTTLDYYNLIFCGFFSVFWIFPPTHSKTYATLEKSINVGATAKIVHSMVEK